MAAFTRHAKQQGALCKLPGADLYNLFPKYRQETVSQWNTTL
jgi:hypothetical protein